MLLFHLGLEHGVMSIMGAAGDAVSCKAPTIAALC